MDSLWWGFWCIGYLVVSVCVGGRCVGMFDIVDFFCDGILGSVYLFIVIICSGLWVEIVRFWMLYEDVSSLL